MRRRTLALSAAAAAVMALVALKALPPDAASLQKEATAPAMLTDATWPPAVADARPGGAATLQPLPVPQHLDGVEPDGKVDLDRNGKLVFNGRLKNLFHHMLGMAEGDPARLPGVRESLKAYLLEQTIAPAAQAEVMAAFDRYVTYLEAASKVQVASYAPGDLERVYQTLALLRRQHLGPGMAEGFFAEQEALDRYTVAQRRLLADQALSPAQRQQQLDALEDHLPEGLRKPLEQSRKIRRLEQDTQALRAAGAGQEAIDRLRSERYGTEAVERFRALDEEQAQWKQRVASYRAERDAIRADASLSGEGQARAIDELVAKRFSETEALRVRGLGKD